MERGDVVGLGVGTKMELCEATDLRARKRPFGRPVCLDTVLSANAAQIAKCNLYGWHHYQSLHMRRFRKLRMFQDSGVTLPSSSQSK